MAVTVTIGQNETIHSADGGEDGRGGLQWGYAQARNEAADNEAHAQCKATLAGVGINAWARVWAEIEVEEGSGGESTSEADFDINGEYDGMLNALGAAASDMWVDLFVRDLSNNDELNNSNVLHASAKVFGQKNKNDTFDRTVASSDELVAGNTYAIGVRAKTTAVASTNPITGVVNTASSDLYTEDYLDEYLQYSGFARFDDIQVEWK